MPDQIGELGTIELEYAFQIRILFKERIRIETPNGYRAYVPPSSGTVAGPRLNGIVVPYSGADYATNGRLSAHYMLQADDGAWIYIHNRGQLWRLDGTRADPNDPTWDPDAEQYFRITPEFDAPSGPHEWLNRAVFVGTGKRGSNPDHTLFTYYVVR